MASSNPLPSFRILDLPVELRQSIYEAHFGSMTVVHGFDTPSTVNTGLLLVSRQIHDEAKPFLASAVSLNFASTAKMLDCLTEMPRETLSQLRHVRLVGYPFPVGGGGGSSSDYMTHCMAAVLPILRGLQLDRLTVVDCYHPGDGWGDMGTYYEIKSLIWSTGWRELHYLTPTTQFMTSEADHYNDRRDQPATWRKELHDRVGSEPGADVRMYVANEPNVPDMALDPAMRTDFAPRGIKDMTTKERQFWNAPSNFQREVLVEVKRGRGAPYVQDGSDIDLSIKHVMSRMTWKELQASDCYINPELDPTAHL